MLNVKISKFLTSNVKISKMPMSTTNTRQLVVILDLRVFLKYLQNPLKVIYKTFINTPGRRIGEERNFTWFFSSQGGDLNRTGCIILEVEMLSREHNRINTRYYCSRVENWTKYF